MKKYHKKCCTYDTLGDDPDIVGPCEPLLFSPPEYVSCLLLQFKKNFALAIQDKLRFCNLKNLAPAIQEKLCSCNLRKTWLLQFN
jgi:hypothetical protein